MSRIRLYHGSEKIIDKPEYKAGRIHNDYGQGFYCTRHIELAKEWAVDEGRDGYVNTYDIDTSDLKILNLNDDKYSILHWLTLLLEHRTTTMNSPVSEDGLKFLKNKYQLDISDYDLIIGYRADDSYFSFARAFISNSISVEQLERSMYLGELGEQYFLQSKKAFSKIQFLEAIPVDYAEYYPMKRVRDNKARADFNLITNTVDKSGVYLIDLMRKEDADGTSI
ncbi:MAG: DUF3990 domain-containing protein [Pseudobutyrivibrio sp.]|nr:DUF3990 domain-containing protein [Pseudobutyrivibrio sp.]